MNAFLGLGSNLGNREKNIQDALKILSSVEGVKLLRISSIYETVPFGKTDQPDFLNAVTKIDTSP